MKNCHSLAGFAFLAAVAVAAGAPPKHATPAKPAAVPQATPAPRTSDTTDKPAEKQDTSGDIGTAEIQALEQGTVSEEAQRISKQATTEFGKGDLAAAKHDFERVLAVAPDNASTLLNLGLIAYRQKAYEESERLLTKVVRAQPEAGVAWMILGVIYYDQNKLDRALAALAQAVLFEPKDARAHHFLGVTIGKKGWYLGAEDEMRKAIELNPDYAEAHFNLAVFYLQRSPPAVELARRHYQKALDLGAAPDPQVEKGIGPPKE